ncbi:hypothetical protein MAM1_0187c07558 [Mucor ambiguus]|uniref:Uncharacterized protein n=1 Tax=Mucor ambiguus TaxID=91626 RepID=A0A0C9MWV5_9FUNG|nr:hypothetical protein MAM1_0187c07558 [Mucor ambiguus]
MPYSNADTTYTKLDEKDLLPSYTDTIDSKSPMLPDTTHKRMDEYSISRQYQQFKCQDMERNPSPSMTTSSASARSSRQCKLVAHIALITGITFLVLAAVFKVESRSHISTAIDNDCPVRCITTCYSSLPFYRESVDCTISDKEQCDMHCGPVGMDSGQTYSVLFIVFVALGGFLVLVQLISSCLRYCCLDYYNKKP